MGQAGVPEARLSMYGLDRSKADPECLAQQWNVRMVTTFIPLKEGREVGRIEERPSRALEDDIVRLLHTASAQGMGTGKLGSH